LAAELAAAGVVVGAGVAVAGAAVWVGSASAA